MKKIVKIDKSMGESRWSQILGVVILIGIVVFAYLFKKGFFQGLF
jgi:uncharacterized membrane protein YhdT